MNNTNNAESPLQERERLEQEVQKLYLRIEEIETEANEEKILEGLKFAAKMGAILDIEIAHEFVLSGRLEVGDKSTYKITEACGAIGYHGYVSAQLNSFNGIYVSINQDDGVATLNLSVLVKEGDKGDIVENQKKFRQFLDNLGIKISTSPLLYKKKELIKQLDELNSVIYLINKDSRI